MKFARYLQHTQVPEWNKAYIDYRGLKKQIAAVRKRQVVEDQGMAESSSDPGTSAQGQVLRLSTTECDSTDDTLRHSSSTGQRISRRMGQPHVVIKETKEISYLQIFTTSISMSPQRKRLSIPMHELRQTLCEDELQFFAKLESELEKVEAFYLDREGEVKEMLIELKRQLQELQDHQKFFQQSRIEEVRPQPPGGSRSRSMFAQGLGCVASNSRLETPPGSPIGFQSESRFDAVEYRRAKKNLRKAVLEHYKKLNALQNFRTLNLVGFQKVLKKWEKVTRIPAQDAYLKEKIEPSAFSSTRIIKELMRDTEDMYTVHFARGDKRKALGTLRGGRKYRTYYSTMFRSGLYLGLAIPALVGGVYESFQPSTRVRIPDWDALLLVYATMFVPVLFSLMIGANIFVWDKLRINHVFIFELDTASKIECQEYAEIPTILLSTLCFSFWLSFSSIASHAVHPQTWPLIWLGFNTLILCNPLPVYHRSSRIWLLKKFISLMISGTKRVGFAEFWLADQFCSLNFSLGNLCFIACMYHYGFGPDWRQKCSSTAPQWPIQLVLAASPFFCRLIQSLRRWYDSGLGAHLINAGKYSSGIIMYGAYFYWRYKGSPDKGTSFAFYILAAMIYSTYACCWDFLADWSVLKIRAKYPLLRDEVLYTDYIPLYYLAIITNFLVRFSWIIYLPSRGPSSSLRTFIVAMLEMSRRWQWNFFRLENEHLGNIDQYRVTRQVPLPYIFDSPPQESDNEDGDQPGSKGFVRRAFSSWSSLW